MRYERLWERLVDFLNGWSTAVETESGRIEVTFEGLEGTTRVVEIVMTRDEWEDMVCIPWGDFDAAAEEVRKALLGLPDHQRFLMYATYELVASETPSLPPHPDMGRLEEMLRQQPEGFGRWVATDGDGNVVDEFRPPRSD